MRAGFRFFSGLLLLLLAACVTTNSPSRWEQVPAAERATIFGTITAELGGPGPMSRYSIKYRNLKTREEANFDIAPGLLGLQSPGDPELQEPGKSMGHFFSVNLPAGDYEFFEVWSVRSSGSLISDYRSRPFSMPFRVEAGGVYYLGELRAYPIERRDVIGFARPDGGYFVWRDNRDRDTALWLKRQGNAAGKTVQKIALDIAKGGMAFRPKPQIPFD